MSNTQAPAYQAVLLGQVDRFEDLSALYPAEESAPEGALILLEMRLSQPVEPAEVERLRQAFVSSGVPPWPGNTTCVFVDPTGYVVSFEWIKGQAQLLTAIILIAAGGVLPGLMTLGGLTSFFASGWTDVWNSLGEMLTLAGFMLLMFSFMEMLKPLIAPEHPRRVRSATEPVVIEEVRQPQKQEGWWSKQAKEAGGTIIKAGAGYVAGKIGSRSPSSSSPESPPPGESTYSQGGGI